MVFSIVMVVLGIIDKLKGKKHKKKPDPLKKGVIKYMMANIYETVGGKDLEIFEEGDKSISTSKNTTVVTKKRT